VDALADALRIAGMRAAHDLTVLRLSLWRSATTAGCSPATRSAIAAARTSGLTLLAGIASSLSM
jgi:hypothetical protein